MSKTLRLATFAIVMALVAAACSSTSEPSSTTAADPGATTTTAAEEETTTTTAPPVVDPEETVQLVIPADLSGYIPYDEVNAAFSAKFPNIELVPGDGFWDAHDEPAFLAKAANQAVNDVLTAGDEYPDTYGPRGIFLDLRPFLEADADKWFNEDKFATQWIYENPGDGAIYSVPIGGNPLVVWYNPDLLAEAGLEMPPDTYNEAGTADWTWDRFTEYAEALSEVTTYGVGIENNILLYGPLAGTNGGSLINEDASEYLIDDPAVVEALDFLTSFALAGTSPEPSSAQDLGGVDSLFQAGELAMWIGGGWMTGAYDGADLGFTPRAAALPNNGVTTGFMSCPAGRIGISAFYDNPAAAYEYLKFVAFDVWDDTDVINSQTEFSPWSNVFGRTDIWNEIMATGDVLAGAYGPDGQDLSYMNNDNCSAATTNPLQPWYGPFLEVRDITLGEMDLVFSGEQSLEDAVAAIKEQADVAILRFNRAG